MLKDNQFLKVTLTEAGLRFVLIEWTKDNKRLSYMNTVPLTKLERSQNMATQLRVMVGYMQIEMEKLIERKDSPLVFGCS